MQFNHIRINLRGFGFYSIIILCSIFLCTNTMDIIIVNTSGHIKSLSGLLSLDGVDPYILDNTKKVKFQLTFL